MNVSPYIDLQNQLRKKNSVPKAEPIFTQVRVSLPLLVQNELSKRRFRRQGVLCARGFETSRSLLYRQPHQRKQDLQEKFSRRKFATVKILLY